MSTQSILAQESCNKSISAAESNVRRKAADGSNTGYDPEIFSAVLRGMKGGMTSDQFAIETGLSNSYICKAVSGHAMSRPSRRTVIKLMSAKTGAPFDRKELVRAAGYDEADLDIRPDIKAVEQTASLTETIRKYYGGDPYIAMSELLRALSLNALKGDVSTYYYRKSDHFEIKDMVTDQIYAGINAYVKPVSIDGDDGRTTEEIERTAVVSIAFEVSKTYSEIIRGDRAKDKIVYILSDNERIYEGCRSVIQKNATRATIAVFTDDHQGFCKEMVLDGTESDYVSLVE